LHFEHSATGPEDYPILAIDKNRRDTAALAAGVGPVTGAGRAPAGGREKPRLSAWFLL